MVADSLSGVRFPTLLDTVILSMGAGLVGTDLSTMSLLAQRRVESWNGGATRMVKWHGKDADEH